MRTIPAYTSEFERFMDSFMARHPDVRADQQRGWYIWWDHRLDLDEQKRADADAITVKPYPYD
jgi:hypothetical protein